MKVVKSRRLFAPYHASPDSEDILCRRKLIASSYLHRAVASDNLLNGMLLIIQTLDMCGGSFIGSRVLYVVLKIHYTIYRWQLFQIGRSSNKLHGAESF